MWVMTAMLLSACGQQAFPVSPTPLAQTPVTTVQGSTYQGYIVSPAGTVTPFNMTLIARGLGQTAQVAAQTPGTTIITGYFSTGAGVTGTVEGALQGTLENGTLDITLETPRQGCDERRNYSGAVTGAGVALLPGAYERSCPSNALDFTVQTTRPDGPACTITVSPATAAFSASGGSGTVTVTTQDRCPWTALVTATFLSISGPVTGVGSATLPFVVQANSGASRQGTIRIGDRAVTITQGAGPSTLRATIVPSPIVSTQPDFRNQCLLFGQLNEWTFQAELQLNPALAPVRITEWRVTVTLRGEVSNTEVVRDLRPYFPQAAGSADGSITIGDAAAYRSVNVCVRGDFADELENAFVVVDEFGTRVISAPLVELQAGDHVRAF